VEVCLISSLKETGHLHYKQNRLMTFKEPVSFYSRICTSAMNTHNGQRRGVLQQVVHTKTMLWKPRKSVLYIWTLPEVLVCRGVSAGREVWPPRAAE